MGKNKASMMVLVMAAGGLIGCGESASEPEALDRAVESFQQAHRGYVPQGADADPLDARRYRQQALRETTQQLDEVAESGPVAQQISARRLLADIDLSAAYHLTREASMAYARLVPRTVKLMSHSVAADRAAARGDALDLNQPELIQVLEQEIQTQSKRQKQLQDELAELAEQLKVEEAAQAEQRQARDQATSQAQSLREQGFVAEGDEQFDLYDQAAKQERQAAVATAEMERRQLNIDMLSSRIDVANSQLSLINELVNELRQRVEAGRQRQQEIEQGVAEAHEARDVSLTTLTAEFQDVLATYREEVDAPLNAAGQRLNQAVRHLDTAQGQAGGGADRVLAQNVQGDRLAALTTHAQLLAEQMQIVQGFHQSVSLLRDAVQQINPDQTEPFDTALSALDAQSQELAAQARQTIESARELAGQVGDSELAEVQSQRLDRLTAIVGNG